MDSNIRKELLAACRDYVEVRISGIRSGIKDLEEALKLETKCSMGDKYETGRAMLHLEFEKTSAQLEQCSRLKKTLSLIPEKQQTDEVKFGSVVKTTKANYFISIPAREIGAGDEIYYAIGAASPIAQALLGKREGETFHFNGREDKILALL